MTQVAIIIHVFLSRFICFWNMFGYEKTVLTWMTIIPFLNYCQVYTQNQNFVL